MHNKNNII